MFDGRARGRTKVNTRVTDRNRGAIAVVILISCVLKIYGKYAQRGVISSSILGEHSIGRYCCSWHTNQLRRTSGEVVYVHRIPRKNTHPAVFSCAHVHVSQRTRTCYICHITTKLRSASSHGLQLYLVISPTAGRSDTCFLPLRCPPLGGLPYNIYAQKSRALT